MSRDGNVVLCAGTARQSLACYARGYTGQGRYEQRRTFDPLGCVLGLGVLLALAGVGYQALGEHFDARRSPEVGRLVDAGGSR